MRELASVAGADPAAFTRLAKAIGYSGWDELRAALTEARRPEQSSPFSGRAKGRRAGPNPEMSLISDKLEAEAAGLARISPGAVAGAFLHERHATNTKLPRLAGWFGNDPNTRFKLHLEPEFVPVASADGWQISNPPIFAMAPLRASLSIFDEAGGMEPRLA